MVRLSFETEIRLGNRPFSWNIIYTHFERALKQKCDWIKNECTVCKINIAIQLSGGLTSSTFIKLMNRTILSKLLLHVSVFRSQEDKKNSYSSDQNDIQK